MLMILQINFKNVILNRHIDELIINKH